MTADKNIILDLGSRAVTSDLEVVMTYESMVEVARMGHDFHGSSCVDSEWIRKYNSIASRKVKIWSPDAGSELDRSWFTPEPFASADIYEAVAAKIADLGLGDEYVDRAAAELSEIESRKMEPVVRHVMYMVHDFRSRGVVWGVGRGSSCACLVLYLLGLNRIDPVAYDIPMAEFFR